MSTVLITGASSGIWKAAAVLFAEKWWNVVATMRNKADGVDLEKYENCLVIELDVTKPDTIADAFTQAVYHFKWLDVVVNNAGYGLRGVFEAMTDEQIKHQYEVNVFGLLRVMRESIKYMKPLGKWTIINISSVWGRLTIPLYSVYNSTKWAVEWMTEWVMWELSEVGITVKLVEPGAVKTDFGGRSAVEADDALFTDYPKTRAAIENLFKTWYEHASTPEQTAEVIYTAATDGKDQLRYIAGKDAKKFLWFRRWFSDKQFFKGLRKRFYGTAK